MVGLSVLLFATNHAAAQTSSFSPAAAAADATITAVCGDGVGSDLDGLCAETGRFDEADFSQASPAHQQALSETQREVQRDLTGDLTGPAGRTAFVRTAAREGRATGFAFNGMRMAPGGSQIAAAAPWAGDAVAQADPSGGLDGRLGAFLNVKYGFGDQDENGFEAGFDFDVIGVLGGVDYRFTDRLFAGVALGYDSTGVDFKGFASGSEFDADNISVSLYGSYYPTDSIYIDLLGTYGFNDFSTERTFGVVNQTATGDTDGNQYGLSATAGYQFTRQMLTFGPYLQGNWQRAEVDSYTETGSGLALAVDEQTLKSVTSVVGVRADYAISTGMGVIVPSVRAEWEHEFSNDSRVIVTQFASDPGTTMNLSTVGPDRNYFNLGVGVAATLPRGVTAFVDYEVLLGHEDLTNHVVTAGARMEF